MIYSLFEGEGTYGVHVNPSMRALVPEYSITLSNKPLPNVTRARRTLEEVTPVF
jgi:hypothetical protein